MMISRYALISLLTALWSSTSPIQAMVVDEWAPFTQPDGTTFSAHVFGDSFEINWVTADGYAFVHNPADNYLYYAKLDSHGDYRASAAKVGIDNPATHGIEKHLQRSATRRAAIQAERIAHGYVKDPARQTVTPYWGNPAHAPCTGASPCSVYVVMVGFADQASGGSVYYADYDQPWGYPMALFNQFFNGGYDGVPAYTGTIGHTSASRDSTENLTVFGSLRAYFHQVHGEDILRFRILNECENDPCGDTDEPVWIPLNATTPAGNTNTKQWYATNSPVHFWNAAEAAAGANLTLPTDFPDQTAPAATQLANKVLYLYAGALITDSSSSGGLHPRANETTEITRNLLGARYVMSERQGFASLTDRQADRFAGIGMHVHEIGHLFGFVHPDGGWEGENPHPDPTQSSINPPPGVTVEFNQANLSGWGSMQSGAHGPEINPNGYSIPHRSCPQPYNPFYRMDLGWNNAHTIAATAPNWHIEPGPSHYYVVNGANGHSYILDYRTNSNFGQYTGWYRFTSSPGLLIWRREPSNRETNPMVIPADGRSIFDARPRPPTANPPVPAWRDRLSDPFGALAHPHGPTVMQATDASHLQHETVRRGGNSRSGNPDPGPSHLAFRNIRNEGTHALVDIYINYWAGPITASTT